MRSPMRALPTWRSVVLLNALPEVALKNSEADVTLVLDFVLVDDVENHVIVLVQVIHDAGFGK